MEDYNREAKRRAEEARMDDLIKPMGNVRPKSRPGTVRPKKRPDVVDVSPRAEAGDQEFVKGYKDGGSVMARGCKAGQMSGKKFSGTF